MRDQKRVTHYNSFYREGPEACYMLQPILQCGTGGALHATAHSTVRDRSRVTHYNPFFSKGPELHYTPQPFLQRGTGSVLHSTTHFTVRDRKHVTHYNPYFSEGPVACYTLQPILQCGTLEDPNHLSGVCQRFLRSSSTVPGKETFTKFPLGECIIPFLMTF